MISKQPICQLNLPKQLNYLALEDKVRVEKPMKTNALFSLDSISFSAKVKETTLEALIDRGLAFPAGIEVELYAPKGMKRFDFVKKLVSKAIKQNYPDKPIYISVGSDNPASKENISFINQYLEKKHIQFLNNQETFTALNDKNSLSKEDKKYLQYVDNIGSEAYIDNTIYVSIGAPKEMTTLEGERPVIWKFTADASVYPLERSVEVVTPKLETTQDLKVFADICTEIQKMDTSPSPARKLQLFAQDLKTQINYRLTNEDKTNQNVPGYQGDKMVTSGYGSLHFHHDATNMTPLAFLNEVNQYYNNQDVLHGFLSPGVSRMHYAKPIPTEYIEDLNKRVLPLFKTNAPETDIWKEMARTFVDHFKRHHTIKYQALNEVNVLMPAILEIEKEGYDIPKPLKTKLADKILSKRTIEWRSNASDTDPKNILLLNTLFQKMAMRSSGMASEGQIIPIDHHDLIPAKCDQQMKDFITLLNWQPRTIEAKSPEEAKIYEPLDFNDYKPLQRPFLDAQFFDQLIAGINKSSIEVKDFDKVVFSCLEVNIPRVLDWAQNRLTSDPKVLLDSLLGKNNHKN